MAKVKYKEAYIELKVCQHANNRGIDHRKFITLSRRSAPDRIFFAKGGFTMFIEFKCEGGKATSGQLREMARLKALKFPVHIVDDIEKGKRIIDYWVDEVINKRNVASNNE